MTAISQRQLFFQHLAQTSPSPLALEIKQAEGIYLFDADGKPYIDLISGIGVSILGHQNPKIVEAVCRQAQTYMHTLVYGEFILSPQVELAQHLTSLLPNTLDNVYFTNSGAEATEGALKLAKRFTHRSKIVSMQNSYHGSTHGALSLMSDNYFTKPFQPLLPQVEHIRFNEIEDFKAIDHSTACVIVETVRAEAGIELGSKAYFQALREHCTQTGTLLIADEIQAGCGRTGKMWAFEHYGFVPDILLLAKGFGGGMPLAAFIAPKHIMESLADNPVLGHITTFGGHPVSCAASLAALKQIDQPLLDNVQRLSKLFVKQFENFEHPLTIRHLGWMMAIDLYDNNKVFAAIKKALDLGLVTDWFLFNDKCLRVAPPLNITEKEVLIAADIIKKAIRQSTL